MLGPRLSATLGRPSDGVFAADLDFALRYETSGPFDGAAPEATYKLLAARLATCPVRVVHSASVELAPCVAADLGAVVGPGESRALAQATTAARFWADVAVEARARWVIVGPLFATLGLGAAFSLARPTFVFCRSPPPWVHLVARVKGPCGSSTIEPL